MQSSWMTLISSAAACLLCFASALGLSSLMLSNKGAKINAAWGLIAVGLVGIAIGEGDRVLYELGFAGLSDWRNVFRAVGALLIFAGVMYGRRLYRKLLK